MFSLRGLALISFWQKFCPWEPFALDTPGLDLISINMLQMEFHDVDDIQVSS